MKALIVDDEPFPAKLLKELIEQYCFEIHTVEIYHSPIEALERLRETHYDLIFLDVEMPNINGIEFVKEAKLNSSTQVIYTTAYTSYAVEAFENNAVHYLVKPIEEDDLIVAVRRAQVRLKKNVPNSSFEDNHLSIFHNNEYVILHHQDIIRLEGDGGYTKIFLPNAKYTSSKRLGFYEKELDSNKFIRCHNSHIINTKFIAKISKGKSGYITLSNDEIIPYSAANKGLLGRFLNT